MPRGVIKFFNEDKGYGFIENDQRGNIYVHYSSIEKSGFRTLEEGVEVRFDLREGQRGLEAINVHKL